MPTTDINAKGMQDYPPLPEKLPESSRRAASGAQVLPDGCYFIAIAAEGASEVTYHGTMRVDSKSGSLFASADLYVRHAGQETIGSVSPPGPGIPAFPMADYTYYLRITDIAAADGSITFAFELSRFLAKIVLDLGGSRGTQWMPDRKLSARVTRAASAPPGYPSPDLFFVGDVLDENGLSMAQLQIGRVSEFVRKATIEIDRMPDLELPLDNGTDVTWQSVFNGFGWEVVLDISDSDIKKDDANPKWTDVQAHAAMRARRDCSDLDAEWRYHILVVRQIALSGEQRGWMYDGDQIDPVVPREGLMLASDYVFPTTEAHWGPLKGVRAGTSKNTYFRTTLHETGHAMGLGHNSRGVFFMMPTDGIADAATPDKPFPTNIVWSYSPEDEQRLRHWPDIVVRPGGLRFTSGGLAPGDPEAS